MHEDSPIDHSAGVENAPGNGVPLDPEDFLRVHPPFDRLGRSAMDVIGRTLEIDFAGRNSTILSRSDPVNDRLFVIRRGVVRLEAEKRRLELLEEGECFGFPSLISGSSPTVDVIAEEECLLYRIPKTTFDDLMDEPAFAAFFVDGIQQRLRRALRTEPTLMTADLASPARDLCDHPPVSVTPDATVAEAARVMSTAGVSSVLVDTEPPAILTDRDLRNRVLARGLPSTTPVSKAWSRPVHTLDASASLYAMLVFMLERRVHHVPLVEDGEVVGVVTDTDLLREHLTSPFHVLRSIDRSASPELLVNYANRLTGLVDGMVVSGLDAIQVARIVSTLNDAVMARVARAAEEDLGPPPCRYALMVHGSEGRREQTLLTDQDNALVYLDETEEAGAYFTELGKRIVGALVQASFPRCAGGFMADAWCKPLAEWRSTFAKWVTEPEPEALLGAANFFDFRRVWGTLSLDPLDDVIAGAADNRIFLAHLAAGGLRFRPPLGLFRTFKDEDGGIDLKKGGILPIVAIARVVGLEAGCRSRRSLDRLDAAHDAGIISGDGAEGLSEAFRYLHRLRLENQLNAHRAGRPISNTIPLEELVSLERRHLKDSFAQIREIQEWLAQRFDADRLG